MLTLQLIFSHFPPSRLLLCLCFHIHLHPCVVRISSRTTSTTTAIIPFQHHHSSHFKLFKWLFINSLRLLHSLRYLSYLYPVILYFIRVYRHHLQPLTRSSPKARPTSSHAQLQSRGCPLWNNFSKHFLTNSSAQSSPLQCPGRMFIIYTWLTIHSRVCQNNSVCPIQLTIWKLLMMMSVTCLVGSQYLLGIILNL